MMLDLEQQLSALVRHWDDEAPAVSIEEAKARVRTHDSFEVGFNTSDDGVDRFVPISPAAPPPRRRWKAVAMIGAAAALVLVGLVVLVRHGGSDEEPFRPGVETIAPPPSASALPSTSAPASTTSTTTTPPDTTLAPPVVPTYADPTTQQLASIQSSVAASLTGVDTLRGLSTWKFSTQDADGIVVDNRVMTNTVTLASNGSMWTTGTTLEWSSYDSTTGIGRTQAIGPDGKRIYTQLGLSSLPLPQVIGLDPTPHFADFGSDAEIGDAEQDGRPVWEITSTHDSTGPDGAVTHTEETLDIDKTTGLVISRANTSTSSGTTTVQTATLTSLELNVDFPPAGFPGSFPPDADVQGASGSSFLHLLTVGEAATFFGQRFVAPTALPATARIYVDGIPNQPLIITNQPVGSSTVQPFTAITFDFPQGFAQSSITV